MGYINMEESRGLFLIGAYLWESRTVQTDAIVTVIEKTVSLIDTCKFLWGRYYDSGERIYFGGLLIL